MFKYLFLILVLFFCNNLNAEDSLLTLKQKLDRLQREVSDLTQIVFKGTRDTESKLNKKIEEKSNSVTLTIFDARLHELEVDIKQLNENFEELIFQIDDLKKLYEELNLNFNTKYQNNIINSDNSNLDEKITTVEELKNNKNNLGSLIISSEDLSDQKKALIIEDTETKETILKLSPEDEFQIAFDLLRSQQFAEAKNALKKFIDNYKENDLAGSAHYWLGEIYLLKKEYREAALVLAEGYQTFPESIKAPDMLYKLSESLIKIDKKKDSCNTLNEYIDKFSKHKFLDMAKSKIISLGC